MISITINHNIDVLEIDNQTIFSKLKDSQQIQAILHELLERLNYPGIKLVSVDDDSVATIGEW